MTNNNPRGEITIQTLAMPADTNANGDIFGGWVVSNMDMAAGIEARLRAKSRAVTIAIDKLVFIEPVYVGDTVACYAKVLKVGRTSMQIKVEVWAHSLLDNKQRHVTEGLFTFVAINEARKPQAVDRN